MTPAESDDEREVVATLDREHPLTTLDAAIEVYRSRERRFGKTSQQLESPLRQPSAA